MPSKGKLRYLLIAAGLCFLLLVFGVISISPLRWRAAIVFNKATDRLRDASWSDIGWMLSRGSGVDLEQLAATRNPYEVIDDPRRSPNDIEVGARVFREQCSSCHGAGARGGQGGPSLIDHVFRQGRSDWALYRTITLGIPGTPMIARSLSRNTVWDLIGYLKEMLAAANDDTEKETGVSLKPVTADELRNADDDPTEWLMYSGSYSGDRHTLLKQINRKNVSQLRVEWERQLSTPEDKVETSPIVRGTTMFITEPPNRVEALDAATGEVLWSYSRELPSRILACCGLVNRGVAILGNRLYVGTLDAHLLALDANSGKLIWDVQVADYSKGYSITGAPLVIDDMVVTGVAGGEYGVRGFIDAYDAASGRRRWRFYTVPSAGQPGSQTWADDSLSKGGAPTWLTGSFDPELRLIYWGVGNPSPNFDGDNRSGDNLYANSVVALDADTGNLKWYFQFTPHDLHDWDSVQIPVLVDATINGTKRKLLAWGNRNGFFYLLDRTDGKFFLGAPFVKQTWADGLDENGRPKVRPDSVPTREGSLAYPGIAGGTNWWSPSYDPDLGLMFIPSVDKGAIFYASANEPIDSFGENLGGSTAPIANENAIVAAKAIDVTTGKIRWEQKAVPRKTHMEMDGLMSTAGGLLFACDGESFVALDSETGEELWRFETGAQIYAAPISYELAGRQYIELASGRSILTFALPPTKKDVH